MDSVKQVFQEYLLKDEQILWNGQPEQKVFFTAMDIFLVPFSLLWGGFAIYWELTVTMIGRKGPVFVNIPFLTFGLFFVIIGLYFIFGRFIYKTWAKKKTFYAVTNKRVLSLSYTFGQKFQEAVISRAFNISMGVRKDGIGTLTFGVPQSSFSALFNGQQFYANTGMDIIPFGTPQLAFFDIQNVNKVYKIIMDIKTRV
jgi:hypothetical protein